MLSPRPRSPLDHALPLTTLSPPSPGQSSSTCGLDYVPAVRCLVRHEELLSAVAGVGEGRRGRRLLSYTSQMGLHLSTDHRLALANQLTDG